MKLLRTISSKVTIAVNTVQFALQIAVLIFLRNYYIYLLLLLIGQIAINVITAIVSHKLFPLYTPKGSVDHAIYLDIKKKVSALFISKIGGVVLGSADTIIISAFLGLTSLAIYQNYFFIISSIYGTVEIILNSITAGLGNSLISETEAKNVNDFNNISFGFSWLIETLSNPQQSWGESCTQVAITKATEKNSVVYYVRV